ncbi:TPA: glycosyltransferase family 2 protein, partial [Klebsiella pneumoniae]
FYHFRESTDFKYGNFTEINREECEIDYRLMINNMMRDSKNSTLLNTLLSNLTNSNMVYKLSNIENKLNERK